MMTGSPPGQTRSSAQAPPCATDMSLMIQLKKKRYAKSRKKDNKKQVDVIKIRESGLFMRGGGVRLLRADGKRT